VRFSANVQAKQRDERHEPASLRMADATRPRIQLLRALTYEICAIDDEARVLDSGSGALRRIRDVECVRQGEVRKVGEVFQWKDAQIENVCQSA
jgi:hypothetical protein